MDLNLNEHIIVQSVSDVYYLWIIIVLVSPHHYITIGMIGS
jgi:hypothetical protein